MDLFSRSPDIHNGVSGHVETVVLLSKTSEAPKKEPSLKFSDMDEQETEVL